MIALVLQAGYTEAATFPCSAQCAQRGLAQVAKARMRFGVAAICCA
jgi:hypothetical protein